MNTDGDEDRFYLVDELAERWRVSPETVRRMIRRGELVAFQLAKPAGYRISASTVAQYEREHTGGRDDA